MTNLKYWFVEDPNDTANLKIWFVEDPTDIANLKYWFVEHSPDMANLKYWFVEVWVTQPTWNIYLLSIQLTWLTCFVIYCSGWLIAFSAITWKGKRRQGRLSLPALSRAWIALIMYFCFRSHGELSEIRFCESKQLEWQTLRMIYKAKNQLCDILIESGFPKKCLLPQKFNYNGPDIKLDVVCSNPVTDLFLYWSTYEFMVFCLVRDQAI